MSIINHVFRDIRRFPEVIPLITVVSAASAYAVYATSHKILSDQDLRVRQNHGSISWEERLRQFEARRA
ncbi:hypothetical protein BC828DRAFT_419147 [Blastocladiella britannica]|nr:hypothetical protein BC828DRAFT_419147 [Blastocladiella britannica]